MKLFAHQQYEQFDYARKQLKQSLAGAEDLRELEELEISLKITYKSSKGES